MFPRLAAAGHGRRLPLFLLKKRALFRLLSVLLKRIRPLLYSK
ncbi:hypothetical protein B4113_1185 [Geobacillus sp. B4113_201601]|nr:hypothetical protein B4113_1185 [Geobacillus sp. B4113_201601]